MRSLIAITLCFVSSQLLAIPPSRDNGRRDLSTSARIVGTWHSTSLSGDAIGLAVEDIVVEFHRTKQFKATVNMNIGEPSIYEGGFNTKQESLTLNTESSGAIDCIVTFQGSRQMTLVGKAHGVKAVFERGSAPESSGGWF